MNLGQVHHYVLVLLKLSNHLTLGHLLYRLHAVVITSVANQKLVPYFIIIELTYCRSEVLNDGCTAAVWVRALFMMLKNEVF